MPQAGTDEDAGKAFWRGTHRLCEPALTIERVRPWMAQFGITRVANLTGLDRLGLPVVMVCRPNSRSSAVFHGKGLDLVAARASGLMEAIETWHGEHVQLPLRLGSHDEMASEAAIADVERLAMLPGRSFCRDVPLLWVEARDLMSGRDLLVPYEVVHVDGSQRCAAEARCFSVSTNGLAAGNHVLEATSHALCELIERDATSLWHQRPLAQRQATRIDVSSIEEADCAALLRQYAAAGFEVGVFDLTSDIGVAVILAVALDDSGEIAHPGIGVGCHPTRAIALLRALSEAAQVRMTYIAGSREDIVHDDYSPAVLVRRQRAARELLDPGSPGRAFEGVGERRFASFEAEVGWLLERLLSVGVEQALTVNLSRPQFGIPVVRALLPGLEGSDHHSGYSPGSRARALRAKQA